MQSFETLDYLNTWEITSPWFYVVLAFGLSLFTRVVSAVLKAMQRERLSGFIRDTCLNFGGYTSDQTKADYWYPFLLGVLEFSMYPVLMATGHFKFIGAWLAFKSLAQWKQWGDDRQAFNRFLIGNAIVILMSFLVLKGQVEIQPNTQEMPNLKIIAPSESVAEGLAEVNDPSLSVRKFNMSYPVISEFAKDFLIPVLCVCLSGIIAYYVAEKAARAETKKGRVLLQTLSQRYFISFLNSFDWESGTIRNDQLSKDQYIAELEAIVSDFSNLSTNLFYQRLIDKTPRLVKCQVQVRRELIEHRTNPNFAINLGTAKDFADLYRESRIDKRERLPIEDIIERVERMHQESQNNPRQ